MLTIRSTRSRSVRSSGTTTATLRARSDDELLLDVGAGDHQAFASLSDHIAGLVYANLRRALHDTTRIDAVAHEALIEVWRQAARFDPSRTPASIWILDLAHQRATEHNRHVASRAAVGRPASLRTARSAPAPTAAHPPASAAGARGRRAPAGTAEVAARSRHRRVVVLPG